MDGVSMCITKYMLCDVASNGGYVQTMYTSNHRVWHPSLVGSGDVASNFPLDKKVEGGFAI